MEYEAEDVRTIRDAFQDGLQAILGSKLVGEYLYGALAFSEAAPTGDIDFHVILKETLTDDDRASAYLVRQRSRYGKKSFQNSLGTHCASGV